MGEQNMKARSEEARIGHRRMTSGRQRWNLSIDEHRAQHALSSSAGTMDRNSESMNPIINR